MSNYTLCLSCANVQDKSPSKPRCRDILLSNHPKLARQMRFFDLKNNLSISLVTFHFLMASSMVCYVLSVTQERHFKVTMSRSFTWC